MIIVAWITFISVFNAYKQTTYCAEWVAGTIAAVGGAPILTALMVGGVVVAGGVALYELSQTDANDHREFLTGIKQGFNEFIAEQEKQIALEQDSSLTDQQASDIGVANAREYINNFWDNAINSGKKTVSNIQKKSIDYWKSYNKDISDVADNGITESSGNGTITDTSPIFNSVYNSTSYNVLALSQDNIGANCFQIGDKYYLKTYNAVNNSGVDITETNAGTSTRTYFPYCVIRIDPDNKNTVYYQLNYISARTSDMAFVSNNIRYYNTVENADIVQVVNNFLNRTSVKCFVINVNETTEFNNNLKNNFLNILAVSSTIGSIPIWKRTINNTLNDTNFGKSIQSGRRQLVNNGDWIGSVFQEDSVPVKKTGLSVNDGTVSGQLGWDIPSGEVWDDVFSGGKPYADVVGGTGVVSG